ncbi:MAG: response regulator [Acidobacteriota bacterium]
MESRKLERLNPADGTFTKRILIADDASSSRELLRSILERSGYDVVEAEDGEQVLEMAPKVVPDVIVLDLQMAGMDGWATVAALRSHPELGRKPIVALAGAAMDVTADQMVKAGFSSYLVKPIGPRKLRECIAGLV